MKTFPTRPLPSLTAQAACAAANIGLIRRLWWGVFSISAVLQIILWPTPENLLCVLLAWISCILTGLLTLKGRVTFLHPWSSLIVLIFCLTTCGLPLVLLLFQGDPLTASLEVPVATFSHLLICHLTLLLIHTGYRRMKIWRQLQNGFRMKVLRPFGLLETPSWSETMAIGTVGLAASVYTYMIRVDLNVGARAIIGTFTDQFIQGLCPLLFAPIVLLSPLVAGQARKSLLFLMLYYLAVLFVAFGNNARLIAFEVLAIIGIALVLAFFSGKIRLLLGRSIFLCFIAFLILWPIYSDLSLAIRTARNNRSYMTSLEMVGETIKLLTSDRNELQATRNEIRQGQDETEAWYVHNPILSRVVNTQFQDRSLAIALDLNDGAKAELRQVEFEHILATLPNPCLKVLGLGIDKVQVNGDGTMGGFLLYLGGVRSAGGVREVLMGDNGILYGNTFATGGFIGDGFAAFGWGYLVIFGGVAFLLFLFVDSLYGFVSQPTRKHQVQQMHFALVGLVNGFTLAFSLTLESAGSISGLISLILRGLLEMLVVYGVVFLGCRFVIGIFFSNKTSALPPRTPPLTV